MRTELGFVLVTLIGACSPPPHLLLTVEDPEDRGLGASSLAVGRSLDHLSVRELSGGFPVTLTLILTEGEKEPVTLWAEARDSSGVSRARGSTQGTFRRGSRRTATIRLTAACDLASVPDGAPCSTAGGGVGICVSRACSSSRCGDGFPHAAAGEECDDGNGANDDACTVDCRFARCGDGLTWDGVEACDDGNTDDGDGCRADCSKRELCGDGVVDAVWVDTDADDIADTNVGEQCDDANDNANDGCDGCRSATFVAGVLAGAGALAEDPLDFSFSGERVVADGNGRIFAADGQRIVVLVNDRVLPFAGRARCDPGEPLDGGPALLACFSDIADMAPDAEGNLFVAEKLMHRVRRIDGFTTVVTTVAGGWGAGFRGDGQPAIAAQLDEPTGVAADGAGNLFIADRRNGRVRKVSRDSGIIDTIAGGGSSTPSPSISPATEAAIVPTAIAYGGTIGKLVVVHAPGGNRGDVFEVATDGSRLTSRGYGVPDPYFPPGIIDVAVRPNGQWCVTSQLADVWCEYTKVAGGDVGFDDGVVSALPGKFFGVRGIAADGNALLIVDSGNARLRRVLLEPAPGTLSTVLGNGVPDPVGDRAHAASAAIDFGMSSWGNALSMTSAGHLLIAEWSGRRIRRVTPDGIISTAAGLGLISAVTPFIGGEGDPATRVALNNPCAVAAIPSGFVISETQLAYRLSVVPDDTSVFDSFASGTHGSAIASDGRGGIFASGGEPALPAPTLISHIATVGGNSAPLVFVAGHAIEAGYVDGAGVDARFGGVSALAYDAGADVLYVADYGNHVIRRVVLAGGVVETWAGDGAADSPAGLAVAADGTLYVADDVAHRVYRVDGTTGDLVPVAGNGLDGTIRDGIAPLDASIPTPMSLVADGDALYVASRSSNLVRRVDFASNRVTTVAGAFEPTGSGPFSAGAITGAAALVWVAELSADVVALASVGRLMRARRDTETIDIIAGSPSGFADGEDPDLPDFPGARARYSRPLSEPVGVAWDGQTESLYVAERGRHVIRRIGVDLLTSSDEWAITTVAGEDGVVGSADGPARQARFSGPSGLAVDTVGRRLMISDRDNHTVRGAEILPDGALGDVTTIAGIAGRRGFAGDQGPPVDGLLNAPEGVAVGLDGSIFVADTGNHRVRRVSAAGATAPPTIDTVLGDGTSASSGAGTPSRIFPVAQPRGIAVDPFGNVAVTSRNAIRLLVADDGGNVDGGGPVHTIYGAAPRDEYPASRTSCLMGLSAVDASTFHIADECLGFLIELRRVTR